MPDLFKSSYETCFNTRCVNFTSIKKLATQSFLLAVYICVTNKITNKTNGSFQTKIQSNMEHWKTATFFFFLTAIAIYRWSLFQRKKHTTDIFFRTCYILAHKKIHSTQVTQFTSTFLSSYYSHSHLENFLFAKF